MTNERLEQIKDSVDFQLSAEKNLKIDKEVILEEKELLDYITNLQEKSNNQTEEINRLYKQREKFMKKYGYLKEENERLKKEQLITNMAYETVLNFYKQRNEKAIEYIKEYVKENSIYYNTSDGCQWVDQFKVLDKIDELLEEVE